MRRSTYIQDVTVENILIDHGYQRPLSKGVVGRMCKEFDPILLGVLFVSKRDNGEVYVFDGQHRLEVIKIMGWKSVECKVFEGLTPIQEAKLFDKYNSRRNRITALDKYNARLFYKDPDAEAIEAILIINGIHAKRGKAPYRVQAIGAVEHVFKDLGPVSLDRILRILVRAYKGCPNAFSAKIILGMGIFVKKFSDGVDDERLVSVLGKTTAEGLLVEGNTWALATSWAAMGIAKAIYVRYNNRLSKNKLPEWV